MPKSELRSGMSSACPRFPEKPVKGHSHFCGQTFGPDSSPPHGLDVSVENIFFFLEVKSASCPLVALEAQINVRTRAHGAIASIGCALSEK